MLVTSMGKRLLLNGMERVVPAVVSVFVFVTGGEGDDVRAWITRWWCLLGGGGGDGCVTSVVGSQMAEACVSVGCCEAGVLGRRGIVVDEGGGGGGEFP
jgi:hypothetical protein